MLVLTNQDNIAERECCGVPCKCTGTRGDRGAVGLPGSKVKFAKIKINFYTNTFLHANICLFCLSG